MGDSVVQGMVAVLVGGTQVKGHAPGAVRSFAQ